MTRRTFWELTRYVFVGALGAIVDFSVFLLLTRMAHVGPIVANIFSVLAGIIHNFIWHKYFTFKIRSRARMHAEFFRFFVVASVCYLIQEVGLPLGLLLPGERLVGPHEDIAIKVVLIGIVGFTSYFVNRAWTFKHRDQAGSTPVVHPPVLP
ncbi:MAG: GtrA family protein [Candidatus Andersenbacteria bacterium]